MGGFIVPKGGSSSGKGGLKGEPLRGVRKLTFPDPWVEKKKKEGVLGRLYLVLMHQAKRGAPRVPGESRLNAHRTIYRLVPGVAWKTR